MKRNTLWGFLLASAVFVPAAAHAHTSVGINVNIGDAPPPPVVVFQRPPRMVMVPSTTVYVVEDGYGPSDYDVFRYGVYWYVFDDGYWYRARSYRGPFRVVNPRYVPTAIGNVPARWWRHPHGGPPGQMKKHDYMSERERDRDHDRGRGHGWKN